MPHINLVREATSNAPIKKNLPIQGKSKLDSSKKYKSCLCHPSFASVDLYGDKEQFGQLAPHIKLVRGGNFTYTNKAKTLIRVFVPSPQLPPQKLFMSSVVLSDSDGN